MSLLRAGSPVLPVEGGRPSQAAARPRARVRACVEGEERELRVFLEKLKLGDWGEAQGPQSKSRSSRHVQAVQVLQVDPSSNQSVILENSHIDLSQWPEMAG